MISSLKLTNLGPVTPALDMQFTPRLNMITGDNGLGKSLILDTAWYALTRTWPHDDAPKAEGKPVLHGEPALPNHDASPNEAKIEAMVFGASPGSKSFEASYEAKLQNWKNSRGAPVKPGLVVYAQVDGAFSIWDPARDYGTENNDGDVPDALRLTTQNLWTGRGVCPGLIVDWENWRSNNNGAWKLFCSVLREFAPLKAPGSQDALGFLAPLPARRIRVRDASPTPMVRTIIGEVPITQLSAGAKRILSLAYALVWTWLRHREDAKIVGQPPAKNLVLLWDEVECHLHPTWQRLILPALMRVLSSELLTASGSDFQIIATTHAPLVMASIETTVNEQYDRLFDLDLEAETGKVVMTVRPWAKFGDANGWLQSPIFDEMSGGYSVEASRAMQAADDFMAGKIDSLPAGLGTAEDIHQALLKSLGGSDPWWPFWMSFYREKTGQL
ncbi:AAA family ATPase [Prosthecobacter sp.]|uniref:AAA family ATPase n=1 Tax=Prosthecobacter sp. TaxID=1965333 RepID=UPI0037834E68